MRQPLAALSHHPDFACKKVNQADSMIFSLISRGRMCIIPKIFIIHTWLEMQFDLSDKRRFPVGPRVVYFPLRTLHTADRNDP